MTEDNIIVYKTVCNNNYKRNFAVCRTERTVPLQTQSHCKTCVSSVYAQSQLWLQYSLQSIMTN